MNADYALLLTVVVICLFNRHSFVFLFAFLVSEVPHLIESPPVYDSVAMSVFYIALSFISKKIKYELQMSLICYSVLFWFAGFDYAFFHQETYFYVIFPYMIKIIDIYVIYHLINRESVSDRFNSSHSHTFNQWIFNLQLRYSHN